MPRIAGPLLACTLALANTPANAQAGATPATPDNGGSAHAATASGLQRAPPAGPVPRTPRGPPRPAHSRSHLPRTRTVGGGERPSSRVFLLRASSELAS